MCPQFVFSQAKSAFLDFVEGGREREWWHEVSGLDPRPTLDQGYPNFEEVLPVTSVSSVRAGSTSGLFLTISLDPELCLVHSRGSTSICWINQFYSISVCKDKYHESMGSILSGEMLLCNHREKVRNSVNWYSLPGTQFGIKNVPCGFFQQLY